MATGLSLGMPAGAETRIAEPITAANAARHDQTGTNAAGGIGDFALSNGTLCAIVSGPEHGTVFGATGGSLVDLSRCDRGGDQFLVLKELVNGGLEGACETQTVRTESTEEHVAVLVNGRRGGVACHTTYALRAGDPERLHVEHRFERVAEGPRVFVFALATGTIQSFAPFTGSASLRGPARGFRHPAFAESGLTGMIDAAFTGDLAINVGLAADGPGIAYGQHLLGAHLLEPDGTRTPVPVFVLADHLATVVLALPQPFWFGAADQLGLFQLGQTLLMDLSPGRPLVVTQAIHVGARADAASVTDQLVPDAPLLRGRVDDPAAMAHVERPDGTPVTAAAVDADGRFALRLPPAAYVLRLRAPPDRERTLAFQHDPGGTELPPQALGTPARIRIRPETPMRLVFQGRGGTPDPPFGQRVFDVRIVSETETRSVWPVTRDLSLDGTRTRIAALPPGRYRVLATRGPEFSVTETEITVEPGQLHDLVVASPVREIASPGWISADLHVHSGWSMDNPTGTDTRLAEFAAQGGEVLVAAEHENVVDFGPRARARGLGDLLRVVPGVEITDEAPTAANPNSLGHANAFPLTPEPHAYQNGAPLHAGRRWRDVWAELRARRPDTVLQLNHARAMGETGPVEHPQAYLSHLGAANAPFDPTAPLTAGPNATLLERDPASGLRDLDFDALELFNGVGRAYPLLRRDWFALLLQGERRVATANSDSHHASELVAVPRSYVALADDDVATFALPDFLAAVRAGKLFGTTGPLLDVRLDETGIGGTFRGEAGTLRVEARCASWVPVDALRVYVNGVLAHTGALAPNAPRTLDLTFSRDAFVVVEIEGSASEPYATLLPGHRPFAFSNPIFVDADADGRWTPPGAEALATLAAP